MPASTSKPFTTATVTPTSAATPAANHKVGLVLFNLGGPLSQNEVEPFLINLFSDPDIFKIINAPVPDWMERFIQKGFAWLITKARLKTAQHNYSLIGGGSPQLKHTQAQAQALASEVAGRGIDATVYVAMRYWHPLSEEALAQITADGVTHLIGVSLYPHFSLTTTGSSVKTFQAACKTHGWTGTLAQLAPVYNKPRYLKALADTIHNGLKAHAHQWTCPTDQVTVLFSAHSLPTRFVEDTRDPYPEQIWHSAQTVMKTHLPNQPWTLAYQSKVGPIPWLEPSTEQMLSTLARSGVQNILVVPISFVSEHIETLCEIDIEYKAVADALGIEQFHRAQTLLTHPDYIGVLADGVADKMKLLGLLPGHASHPHCCPSNPAPSRHAEPSPL